MFLYRILSRFRLSRAPFSRLTWRLLRLTIYLSFAGSPSLFVLFFLPTPPLASTLAIGLPISSLGMHAIGFVSLIKVRSRTSAMSIHIQRFVTHSLATTLALCTKVTFHTGFQVSLSRIAIRTIFLHTSTGIPRVPNYITKLRRDVSQSNAKVVPLVRLTDTS